MAKFKVGDKVRIKPVSEIKESQHVYFLDAMREYAGSDTIHVVIMVDDHGMVRLENIRWRWDPKWLEPVYEEQKILPGYVVKRYYENCDSELYLATMVKKPDRDSASVCIANASGWDSAECKSDVLYDSIVRVEVYGYATSGVSAVTRSTEGRELLWTWERDKPAPKKMTVKEVCEALGYDVQIVKDGDGDA